MAAALLLLAVAPAGASLLVVCGFGIGFADNGFTAVAGNLVDYTFANGRPAPQDFAIFQVADPGGATVVKTAISSAGHTFATFAPADLAGFDFGAYRVVVLNWDGALVEEFLTQVIAANSSLEAYVRDDGVVWVQASLQYELGGPNSFPLPFGGSQVNDADQYSAFWVVDADSPMVAGLGPNPIGGQPGITATSHATDLPGTAHVVARSPDAGGVVTLHEIQFRLLLDGFESGTCSHWSSALPGC